jgi:hypothetical protein
MSHLSQCYMTGFKAVIKKWITPQSCSLRNTKSSGANHHNYSMLDDDLWPHGERCPPLHHKPLRYISPIPLHYQQPDTWTCGQAGQLRSRDQLCTEVKPTSVGFGLGPSIPVLMSHLFSLIWLDTCDDLLLPAILHCNNLYRP